jgi:glycosyltransferase involved in cell wall biosynthesis
VAAIDFLHRGLPFSGETLRSVSMGGTESSIVQLAEALGRRGHDVAVFNGVEKPSEQFGVRWRPLAEAGQCGRGEIGIAVSSAKVFRGLSFRSPVLWMHNPTKTWRQIRRCEGWPLLRTRPDLVILGQYHDAHVPRWLPFRSRTVIHHGVHEDFFRQTVASQAPPPRAIFTSQPYRGLNWLLSLWGETKARAPLAELNVFAPKAHQAAANAARSALDGVTFRKSLSQPELARELMSARIQLIPGHRDETYCLAAAEAVASGVPIVTLGVGALAERVRDGETGFIARDASEFAARTAALLTDDVLWRKMHEACLSEAALTTWDVRAEEWEQFFVNRGSLDPLHQEQLEARSKTA